MYSIKILTPLKHDWIAQMVKGLSSVGPGSGFDSCSPRDYLRTDTQIVRL